VKHYIFSRLIENKDAIKHPCPKRTCRRSEMWTKRVQRSVLVGEEAHGIPRERRCVTA